MGMLINGEWQVDPNIGATEKGRFIREKSIFRNRISADKNSEFLATADRYHLYISYACPWASRTTIFRQLKGLQKVISLSSVLPLMGDFGWKFAESGSENEYADPIMKCQYLYELYQLADHHYTGKVTVPVLWDKQKKTIVNNESSEIIQMLNSEFNQYTGSAPDYYPSELHQQIDEINEYIYNTINNGVYRCGFATTQEAYEEAFDELFAALDRIDSLLNENRYLVGNVLTEADWRLFTTLIRFDPVYYSHFKCNLRRIEDYNNLSNYLRELYQIPGIAETVRFDDIKQHYYRSHKKINPNGIVPKGPELHLQWPHNRSKLFKNFL